MTKTYNIHNYILDDIDNGDVNDDNADIFNVNSITSQRRFFVTAKSETEES